MWRNWSVQLAVVGQLSPQHAEVRKLLTCVVAEVEQKSWMERASSHTYFLSPLKILPELFFHHRLGLFSCTSCPECHCSFHSSFFTLCVLHWAYIFSQIFDYLHTVLAFNHPDLLFCIVFDLFHVLLISIAALLSAFSCLVFELRH